MDCEEIIRRQEKFFAEGYTLDIQHRRMVLRLLRSSIKEHKQELLAALKQDLEIDEDKAYRDELAPVVALLGTKIRKLLWAAIFKAIGTRTLAKAEGYILIDGSSSQHPVLDVIAPLADALGCGNTAIVKLSATKSETSDVLRKMLEELFTEDYVALVDEQSYCTIQRRRQSAL